LASDSCETFEDIKHVSICMYNLPWFLNKSTMNKYVKKVEQILFNNKPQDDEKVKCIIKVLRLLNSPYWANQNIDLIRSLLLALQDKIQHIALYDMIQLQMVYVYIYIYIIKITLKHLLTIIVLDYCEAI
jgi:hypothetical protein